MTAAKATKRAGRRSTVYIKRAYAAPEAQDGTRVLVDRLWPRGLQKEKAEIDLWLKDIAPSDELRRWFHHDPERWDEFQRRYGKELAGKREMVDELRGLARRGPVTLVFAARDVDHNNAIVLQSLLRKRG